MKRFAWLFAVALFSSAIAQYPGAQPVPSDYKAGFDAILKEDIKKWIEYLAGPECEGRGTGQPGYKKAADYVAGYLQRYGAKPLGDNGSYFHHVPFFEARADNAKTFMAFNNLKLSAGREINVLSGAGMGEEEAEIVFVQGGGDARLEPNEGFSGKIVIVFGKDVNPQLRRQTTFGSLASFTVVEKLGETTWTLARGPIPDKPPTGLGAVRGEITLEAAQRLAKALGVPDSIAQMPDLSKGPFANRFVATEKVKITTSSEFRAAFVANVVGIIEGSDPELKAEFVGVGAHLDHLGKRGNVVFWGADDDASGCAAVLGVAKALHENPNKPKRSVILMFFAAEEAGLIGSRYITDNPTFDLTKMTSEFQLDMVGRNEESRTEKASDNEDTIHLVGTRRVSNDIHDLMQEANKYVNFKFEYDEEGVYGRSDHINFARKGIPIAFLFSGFHPDYHQPGDTVDKINYDKATNASKLAYIAVSMSANRTEPFKKIEGN